MALLVLLLNMPTLQTRNLTLESVKERLTKEITDMYKLEFILQSIADEAKLEVKQEDLQALFFGLCKEYVLAQITLRHILGKKYQP